MVEFHVNKVACTWIMMFNFGSPASRVSNSTRGANNNLLFMLSVKFCYNELRSIIMPFLQYISTNLWKFDQVIGKTSHGNRVHTYENRFVSFSRVQHACIPWCS